MLLTESFFPFGFERTGYQAVLRLHSTIATLGSPGFVSTSFHLQPPLSQLGVMFRLEVLFCQQRGFGSARCYGRKKSPDHGFVDARASDAKTPDASAVDDRVAGTVVTGGRVLTLVIDTKTTATTTAGGEPLQHGRAFSYRAAGLVRSGAGVAGNAGPDSFRRFPNR